VSAGGLIWEHGTRDWEWVLGVNLMGVAHGVRVFTPMMLQAERADPRFVGHIVNTASMAGLVNMPNMGAYNVSKHAVVSLSETLYQDPAPRQRARPCARALPVLRPHRHRPERSRPPRGRARGRRADAQPVRGPGRGRARRGERQGERGRGGAARDRRAGGRRFYIYSHPNALGPVMTRAQDILRGDHPSDPYAARPELGAHLKATLRQP
jgi:NAD(P)-dependent dehydrogenase (short-subunit alcohol dehydrogenase family)